MAAKDWDINSRNYSINENIYDINSNKWVFYDTEDPYEFIFYEAYLLIFDKIEIAEDRRTKIVKITLDHASPYIAKEWLDWLIFDLNDGILDIVLISGIGAAFLDLKILNSITSFFEKSL